jgi:hypothetical protein
MNSFDHLDQQLRDAFRRVEPPPDLAARILRRVEPRRPRRLPRWLAAAAAVLAVAGGSIGFLRWQESRVRAREAERVRRQLVLTLEITSRTLSRTEQRLRSIGVETIRLQEVPE